MSWISNNNFGQPSWLKSVNL